jgi:hypothetical protein
LRPLFDPGAKSEATVRSGRKKFLSESYYKEASEEEVEHIKKKRSYSDDDDDVISGRKAGIHHLW